MKKVLLAFAAISFTAVSLVSCSKDPGTDNQGSKDDAQGGTAVDLGLSVKWAQSNLGATKPEESGQYYQWGDTQGYTSDCSDGKYFNWSSSNEGEDPSLNITYKYCQGTYNTITKYCNQSDQGSVDNKTQLEIEDDAARAALGGKWRIPTVDEWEELLDEKNCSWTWTEINGKSGYKVQSKKAGFTDNWIFIPVTGWRSGDYLQSEDNSGYYWSSTLDISYSFAAYAVTISNDRQPYVDYQMRCDGNPIRPVTE